MEVRQIANIECERNLIGWMAAAAAAVLVAGGFEVARSSVFSPPELRSEHAQPGAGVPPDLLGIVSGDGKTFHAAGCPYSRQSPHSGNPGPGSAATRICPLCPLHEKVSDRLISVVLTAIGRPSLEKTTA